MEAGICLNSFLERDFNNMEAFLKVISEGRHVILGRNEVENECSKINTLLNCYQETQKKCANMKKNALDHLLPTLEYLYDFLCDDELRLKTLLENIGCISRVSQGTACPNIKQFPQTTWYQMLRFEIGSETCSPLKQQLDCATRTEIIERYCGNSSNELYTTSMEQWISGWCWEPKQSSVSKAIIVSPEYVLYLLIILLYQL